MWILITSLSAFVVLVALLALAVRKRPDNVTKGVSSRLVDIIDKEVQITETPTYHETKQQMAVLKNAVDSFVDGVNELVRKRQHQSDVELIPILAEDLSFMHGDLEEAQSAAEKVLCVVENRPFMANPTSVPPSRISEDDGVISTDSKRVLPLMSSLVDTMEEVGPIIAGYYLSLTLPDEEKRVAQAAIHAKTIIGCLEDASRKMTAIEKEIRSGMN